MTKYREEKEKYWRQLTIYCPWGEHLAHKTDREELACYRKWQRRSRYKLT